jgi:hypothetical protein
VLLIGVVVVVAAAAAAAVVVVVVVVIVAVIVHVAVTMGLSSNGYMWQIKQQCSGDLRSGTRHDNSFIRCNI